jgi:hypothetical protein
VVNSEIQFYWLLYSRNIEVAVLDDEGKSLKRSVSRRAYKPGYSEFREPILMYTVHIITKTIEPCNRTMSGGSPRLTNQVWVDRYK